MCRTHDSATKTQGQGNTSRSRDFLPFNLVCGPYLISYLYDFLSNFTQMFPSVRQCTEPMTQLRTVKVKVTLQGNGIYHSISCPLHISRTIRTIFVKLTQMFLSVRLRVETMTQLRSLTFKVTLRGYGIRRRGI